MSRECALSLERCHLRASLHLSWAVAVSVVLVLVSPHSDVLSHAAFY